MNRWADALRWCLLAPLVLVCHGCDTPRPARPNVVWVVWDTVRADRMSLYGHSHPTTPKLEAWARRARVFTNVTSAAGTTVPSHGSMFTGLLPSQQGAFAADRSWDESHETIAERFHAAGYRTYLWSANPHISKEGGFHQGFDSTQHPWDEAHRSQALAIVRRKIAGDRSTELGRALNRDASLQWAIKAAGELAEPSLAKWLEEFEPDKPFFAFLNYMEAHRPYVPPRKYREKTMSPEQVARSYEIDRSWIPIWSFTFGLHEYTEEELELFARVYDATLLELDDLFASLLASLEAGGRLDDVVVVLTADHGEHLGEQHMLDHQYSVYEPVLRVPLVLYYPRRVPPGREERPVMNLDIHHTLLELAGIASTDAAVSRSLLSPDPKRVRVGEYSSIFDKPFDAIRGAYPSWEPGRFGLKLRALYEGDHKLILAEDGRRQLYDVGRDPSETNDLSETEAARADRLEAALSEISATLLAPARPPGPETELSPQQRELLRALGYLAPEAD